MSPKSAIEFAQSDAQLIKDSAFQESIITFNSPASDDVLAKAVKALEEKNHKVRVFETGKEATEYISSLIQDGTSVSLATSMTIAEIGLVDVLKTRDDKITNYKAMAAAAEDAGKQFAFLGKGLSAQTFVSSVGAVSTDGNIHASDWTGTRIGGWLSSGHLVLVLGSNKIVTPDQVEARMQYQLALESARARVVYGVLASAELNSTTIRSGNPYGARITLVIVKTSLGF